jgi:nucleotide-binding universal stress UspA family protein
MRRKIIVGYDGSDGGRDALALGRRLARATGAGMLVANVYRSPGNPDLKRGAQRVLAQAPAGERARVRAVSASSAARGLHDLAEELEAALIVVGSTHRHGVGVVVPGTTAEQVLQGAPCAVAVAPAGYATHAADRPGRVAVGIDGSPGSLVALAGAVVLARALGAQLRVIAAVEDQALREERGARLDEALAAVADDVPAEGVLRDGDPVQVLRDEADCDLVVLGSRGYGRVRGAFVGSVSARVVRGSASAVLIVPPGVDFAALVESDGAGASITGRA